MAGLDSRGIKQALRDAKPVTRKSSDGTGGEPPSLPPGDAGGVSFFEMRADGLYRLAQGKERPELRVCGPFSVVARTRDERGSNWGVLLRWQDSEGRQHEWAMPRELLAGDGKEMRARLLKEGLTIEPHRHAREALMHYLCETKPVDLMRCVTRIGWHHGTDKQLAVYVLPDEVFGSLDGDQVMLQSATELMHAFHVSGTVEQWRAEIGARAVGNSRLAFAISAAFGAALLDLAAEPSGGVNLQGGSRLGKSTALRVAGSVWGGGGVRGYVEQWRATSNALEGVAAMHCDALLCLDEMGQVDGREAGEIAYSLANEAGKSRATREGGQRSTASWRTLFLSTGEVSLVDKMREAGQRARAGQEVRLVDVPADAGVGLGLFEELHGFETADAFARALVDGTRRFYGAPARAFLARLVEWIGEIGRDEVARFVFGEQREIIERCVPAEASGQVLSVARRFGLIAAGGELATRFGLTGWRAGEARRATDQCFLAWLDRRGTPGALEDAAAIHQVRKFIAQHAEARFVDAWNREHEGWKVVNRAGFKRRTGSDAVEFMILADVWTDEVCEGIDARAAATALRSAGFLLPGDSGKNSCPMRVPGIGKRVRVYRVIGAILGDGPSDQADGGEGGDQDELL